MKAMKSWLAAAVMAATSFTATSATMQLERVVEGLNGPYDMIFNNGDMVVTTNEHLLKINLSAEHGVAGSYNVTRLADVPDIALGVIASGADYYVLRNADRTLIKVSHQGDMTVVSTALGAPIEIARQGEAFIVSDLGDPLDSNVNSRLLRISDTQEVSVIANADREMAGFAGIEVLGEVIWLTDFNLGRLLKVDADGVVSEVASGLGHPVGIEFDGSDFIIADFGDGMLGKANGRILRVSTSGQVKTISKGRFKQVGNPGDIVLQGADIYFSDLMAGTISKLSCGLCKRRFKR